MGTACLSLTVFNPENMPMGEPQVSHEVADQEFLQFILVMLGIVLTFGVVGMVGTMLWLAYVTFF